MHGVAMQRPHADADRFHRIEIAALKCDAARAVREIAAPI